MTRSSFGCGWAAAGPPLMHAKPRKPAPDTLVPQLESIVAAVAAVAAPAPPTASTATVKRARRCLATRVIGSVIRRRLVAAHGHADLRPDVRVVRRRHQQKGRLQERRPC